MENITKKKKEGQRATWTQADYPCLVTTPSPLPVAITQQGTGTLSSTVPFWAEKRDF